MTLALRRRRFRPGRSRCRRAVRPWSSAVCRQRSNCRPLARSSWASDGAAPPRLAGSTVASADGRRLWTQRARRTQRAVGTAIASCAGGAAIRGGDSTAPAHRRRGRPLHPPVGAGLPASSRQRREQAAAVTSVPRPRRRRGRRRCRAGQPLSASSPRRFLPGGFRYGGFGLSAGRLVRPVAGWAVRALGGFGRGRLLARPRRRVIGPGFAGRAGRGPTVRRGCARSRAEVGARRHRRSRRAERRTGSLAALGSAAATCVRPAALWLGGCDAGSRRRGTGNLSAPWIRCTLCNPQAIRKSRLNSRLINGLVRDYGSSRAASGHRLLARRQELPGEPVVARASGRSSAYNRVIVDDAARASRWGRRPSGRKGRPQSRCSTASMSKAGRRTPASSSPCRAASIPRSRRRCSRPRAMTSSA